MRRKICVVVASRANYGRIKSALRAIEEHPELELQLVVAASALLDRFGRAIDIIKDEGFQVRSTAYLIIEGENPTTMAKSTGLAMIELATTFENLRPDVVLTVADRFETMATAVAASYMNIPVAHTQGGEVTGSIDESVRHAITKLSHLHFPATQLSAERLVKMGEDPADIVVTGCPGMDLVVEVDHTLDFDPIAKYGGVGSRISLSEGPFAVVLQHPVTTEYGQGRAQITETLYAVSEVHIPIVWLWPNVDAGSDEVSKGIRAFREANSRHPIRFFKNFSPTDYVKLLANCACIVGNSSSGIREGSLLGTPCVNIGSRQRGRERGPNVVDVCYDRGEIRGAVERQVENGRYQPDHRFGNGNAGKKIAHHLARHEFRIQKRLQY